jgi:hypothetical protein
LDILSPCKKKWLRIKNTYYLGMSKNEWRDLTDPYGDYIQSKLGALKGKPILDGLDGVKVPPIDPVIVKKLDEIE